MKVLLTLGHGYCAAHVSRNLIAQGWRVLGTIRAPEQAERLRAQGVEPVLWPEEGAAALRQASHILASAAPLGGRDPFLTAYPDLTGAKPAWIGYLSTTGVYGDRKGEWVDEESAPAPARGRSSDRLKAEGEWRAMGAHIFRLSGIYGPGRGPFQKLKEGTARRIVKEGQMFSRIHVEDIAQTLIASMARPNPGAIYNLADDEPAPADVVLEYAAELAGLQPPPALRYEEADLPPMARSFYEECRRVHNDKIKSELGVKLLYPSYREGLAAILRAEKV